MSRGCSQRSFSSISLLMDSMAPSSVTFGQAALATRKAGFSVSKVMQAVTFAPQSSKAPMALPIPSWWPAHWRQKGPLPQWTHEMATLLSKRWLQDKHGTWVAGLGGRGIVEMLLGKVVVVVVVGC